MSNPNHARLLYKNIAKITGVTASSAAPSYPAGNMLTTDKAETWRATGKTASLSGSSATPLRAAVAYLFGNFSPTMTARLRVTNEPSVTNLLTQTEQLDNVAWSRTRMAAPTANAVAAPDGTLTAESIAGDGAGSSYFYQGKSLTQNQGYTYSIFIKAGTYAGAVAITDFTQAGSVTLNLTTRAIAVSGIASNPILIDFGNGWLRLAATFTPTIATGVHNIAYGNFNSTNNIYVWGLMANAGGLSSYYPSGATSGVRPLGHIDAWQTYAYDSGNVLASQAPAAEIADFTPAQAASAYAHGGGASASVWFPEIEYSGWRIDLADPNNLQGYIEAAFLVIGSYWSPTYDVEGGIALTIHDTAVKLRSAAGSLRARKGFRYRTMPFDLTALTAADRREVLRIFRYCGTTTPILVVLYPEDADPELERDTTILGMLDEVAELVLEGPDSYATSIPIQEL